MTEQIQSRIRSQLRAIDDAQDALDIAEIVARSEPGLRTCPFRRTAMIGPLIAVASLVATVVLIVGLALLFSLDTVELVDPVGSTTQSPKSDTGATGFGSLSVTTHGVLRPTPDVDVGDLSMDGRFTTPSPLGEIDWTVYRPTAWGSIEGAFGGGETSDALVGTTMEKLVSSSGIQVDVTRQLLAARDDVSIVSWRLHVNWHRTLSDEATYNEQREAGIRIWPEAGSSLETIHLASFDESGGPPERLERVAELQIELDRNADRWTAVMVEAESGIRIGSIEASLPGLSQDEVLALLDGEAIEIITVSSGSDARQIDPAWTVDRTGLDLPEVLTVDGAFIAVSPGGAGADVWRSEDGVAWDAVGEVDFPPAGVVVGPEGDPAEPVRLVTITERDGVFVADLWNGDQVYAMRRSTDGVEWVEPRMPPVPTGDTLVDSYGNIFGNPHGQSFSTDAGWIWVTGSETDPALWVSEDADTWHQVNISLLPLSISLREESGDPLKTIDGAVIGDRIAYWSSEVLIVGEVR